MKPRFYLLLLPSLIFSAWANAAPETKTENSTPPAAMSADAWERLASYQVGSDTAVLKQLDAALRQADPKEKERLATDLLKHASRPNLTPAAKREIAERLGVVGPQASVAILQSWAADPEIADIAIRALNDQPGAEAEAALVGLLQTAPAPARPALLSALGVRRVAGAVSAVSGLLQTSDRPVVEAALDCLGRIGTTDAWKALQAFTPKDDALRAARGWARLRCAEQLRMDGHVAEAADGFRELLREPVTPVQRVAAAQGLTQAAGSPALRETMALLNAPDIGADLAPSWLRGATRVEETGAAKPISELATSFNALPTEAQETVLRVAAQIGRPALLPLAWMGLASTEPAIRHAAILAAGACVTERSDAERLRPHLARPEDRGAAVEALSRARVKGLEELVRAWATEAEPAVRTALLEIAANRVDRAAMPLALEACASPSPETRQAGFRALRLLVRGEDLPTVLDLRAKARTAAERRAWHDAVLSAVRYRGDTDAVVDLLDGRLKSDPDGRSTYITALTWVAAPKADSVLERLLADPSVEARKEVIRTLSSARNPRAADHLIVVAEKGADPSERILALRGFADTFSVITEPRAPERVAGFRRVWNAATRDEDREEILASMSRSEDWDTRQTAKKLRTEWRNSTSP